MSHGVDCMLSPLYRSVYPRFCKDTSEALFGHISSLESFRPVLKRYALQDKKLEYDTCF
jgi:hypothetical protein